MDGVQVTNQSQICPILQNLKHDYFDLAGDSMLIIDLSNAHIIAANQAACDNYGYTMEELLNMSIMDLEAYENEEKVFERITRLKKEGRLRFESALIKRDGTHIPIDVNVRLVEHSGKSYALSICRDITQNKKISHELQHRERQLAEAQSIAHIGSWEYNLVSGDLIWSQELYRIYGVDPSSFVPSLESLMGLAHIKDRTKLKAWIDDCSAGNMPNAFEFRVIRPDGSLRIIEGQGHLFRDAEGRPSYMAGTAQDITERKASEQKLAETMRLLKEKELNKSRFLAAAGHDLRQPITAANLFIGSLKTTDLTPAQAKIVANLDQAMANLNELLSALLNVSRLDAGVIIPEYTSISVSGLLNWLEDSFSQLAHEKNLRFKVYFPVKVPLAVHGDVNLLKTALSNLVSNAIKFTVKGDVLISARPRGNRILFQVWDSGPGIPSDSITRVFDEFVQLSNPQRDISHGVGLGLPIAKRALSLLNSELTCRSRIGRGSGTVFEFSLSGVDATSKISRAENTTDRRTHDRCRTFATGKRFIIVEDDPLIADAFENSLRAMGAEVSCFRTAEDAIADASGQNADCYIVDQMLGGRLTGIEYLDMVRATRSRPLRAAILTGDTSPNFIRIAEGSDWPIIYKPARLDEIIVMLCEQPCPDGSTSQQ